MRKHTLAGLIAIAALTVPSAALAHGHGSGKGTGQGHGQGQAEGHAKHPQKPHGTHEGRGTHLVFKGTLSTVDAAAGTATVQVTGGNHATRTYKGTAVTFTLATAKLVAADRDSDGKANEIGDLRTGDRVVITVRLTKGQAPSEPFAARQLVDQAAK